jgi:NAD(P)H-dependent flavin oxidoreductase YrpB (nitropropane dioxygenase family)
MYRICDGIALSVPVVQALLGSCDGASLAAAVSRAGALGTLTIRAPQPRALSAILHRIRRVTARPVLLAFNAEWESEKVLMTALEHGFRHFQLFWWNGARLSRRIHEAGGVVFWQVGTLDQARDARDCGADVLVAQGTEAGGQVRSPHPIRDLLSDLLAITAERPIPIIAGGGLATRTDVADMLAGGAAAALLGTRFLLSEESTAPRSDKLRLCRQGASDALVLDPDLVGDWPCAPRRRLCLESREDRPSLFAGTGLDRMRTIAPAAEIVRSLVP